LRCRVRLERELCGRIRDAAGIAFAGGFRCGRRVVWRWRRCGAWN
jgi:hypothetical protein